MCELYAFGTCRCAAGVVDRCSCVFIGSPILGFDTKAHQNFVGLGTNNEFVFALNCFHCFFKFGINEQYPSTRVLDDVLHFFGNKPEVDWNQNSA